MSDPLEDVLLSRARVRVLKIVFSKGEANISQVVRETGLNHKLVSKHLKHLVDAGLVEEVRIGRLRLFRPNWLNPKARIVEELINIL
ncbi:MAG: winged helix-turn-helix domain-containing protein [Zestosphaera sp.]